MFFGKEIKKELIQRGADFVHFVDVSKLNPLQNKGLPNAVLIGIVLSPEFIQKLTVTPDFVSKLKLNNQIEQDEFHLKEKQADQLADYIAGFITKKGYAAYSQSEEHIESTGFYNHKKKSTPLPHKTIAGLAGIGWIGKHNLLVSSEYGSAICMCTVLTDAPVKTILSSPLQSQCGNCNVCQLVCNVEAIKGKNWSNSTTRDDLVDVYKCTTCLMCLALCPWTQKYMKKHITGK